VSPAQIKYNLYCRQKACVISATSWLTPRELEVARLVCFGLSNKEISTDMGVATKTIEHMRQSAYRKLNAHSTLELLAKCLRLGAITAEEFKKYYEK